MDVMMRHIIIINIIIIIIIIPSKDGRRTATADKEEAGMGLSPQ